MKWMMGLFVFLFSSQAFTAELKKSFEQIWGEFSAHSYYQKSLEQEKQSQQLALERASRHWIPRAYVSGQLMSTNDPTQVFFNNLGQRAITQSDFIPDDLNHPGRHQYRFATLGIDMPLYEGGVKQNQKNMYQSLVQAAQWEIKAKQTEEYAELGKQYGFVLIHTKDKNKLNELKNGLDKIVGNYQVGSQSNPVGYSGLLGLKGVGNRIQGMLSEYDLKIANAKNWINQKIENEQQWTIENNLELKEYMDEHLSKSSSSAYSSMLTAQETKVKTLDDMEKMEKARFLPKVGLFAQNNIYNGSRDTSTAQAFGVYVVWDLFNNDSYGRGEEARVRALAGKAKLEAGKREEKIMEDQLFESKQTLEKNLTLLENTDELLKEQTSNAMKLFRSGMLSALQLAEVINRRVDLIENKNKAENQYLDVQSKIYQLNN